jgi:outer membrane protein OmpA-like peptidoglycan-associated protein
MKGKYLSQMPAAQKLLALFLVFLMVLAACATESKTQKGAVYGAGGGAVAGAIIGQIIGRSPESTLIGAAIGAAVGGAAGAGIGSMMDKQEKQLRQELADSDAAAVRREGNLLAISLKGDVTFDKDSAIIKPGLYPEIYKIADALMQYPDTVARVEGHTDNTGTEAYNMDLSVRRAQAVKNILIQRGVPSSRVEAVGFGESMPIATNDIEAGRAQNRRVEIKIAPVS